jgi:7-alpha-hydroxysteroid dehydrogenase
MSIVQRLRLDGRVAVVTGAGRGIGAGCAAALAEAGADVVLAARSREQLDATAAAIEAVGRAAHPVVADLDDLDQVRELARVAGDRFGRIDVVVNNVGGATPKPFPDTTVEELEQAFHFNVSTGSVVNISSVMALIAGRGYLSYGVAKGALAHYTELAAQDLAPRVRVNAIAAGTIATSATAPISDDPELLRQVEAATPLRRLGTVEDVATAVVYLASPAGSYITGAVLDVHGGLQSPSMPQRIPDV